MSHNIIRALDVLPGGRERGRCGGATLITDPACQYSARHYRRQPCSPECYKTPYAATGFESPDCAPMNRCGLRDKHMNRPHTFFRGVGVGMVPESAGVC